jgi:hypothetical protein
MEPQQLLRVVALRRGSLKPVEFRLREGEKGLSLFAQLQHPDTTAVIEAVRAAGKQGDLAAAVLEARELQALGLVIIHAPGGTPVAEVNAIHFEARLPRLRGLFLWLRGKRLHEFFNERFSERVCGIARLLGERS